jgi:two-component system CheB/CheR fusion protein
MRRSAHPFRARRRPVQIFAEDVLRQLLDRLRAAFGVDFGGYKRSTIERRIERRMALQKIDRVEEYLKFLEVSGSELSLLYGDLLIGVTGFFRDREPFETLKEVVFPRLLERRSTDMPIRIWVTGCATGEEAYSVAMSLLEYLGDRAASYRIQIFATDIDDQALNRARQGVYPPNIELDVSPDRLQRFFSRHEKGYQVARPIRDMVVFARHNLGKDPPFSRVDLVTCRNVLIYMQPALQRRVLRIFHYALNPDAFLLLGTSESVGDASELFSLLDRRIKVYLKKNTPSAAVFDFALGARAGAEDHRSGAPIVDHRPEVSMQQLADRKVIEKYGPPAVLLNEQLEIIQFRGHTGPFLAPAPGTATFNIFKLARPELLMELRATLQRASVELVAVSSSPIPGWDGRNTPIVIDVMPLQDAGANRRCLLVSFRELAVPPAAAEAPAAIRIQERHPGLAELERDLVTTKEYLQTTVQELEVANEGLQSSNEELQSSNEELQSTNEELETSKEELQSTNEELATVNEELQNRMAQLALANDDLQNMLACVSSSMVIVGMDLRIRRFTSTAEKLLSLIATDVGRPVAYLGAVIKAPQIEQIVAETINTVSTREQRVRAVDGHWYMMRISPYRTADHAIRGVVIELNRATAALRKGVPPDDVNELVAKSFTKLPFAVMFLDAGLRIVWVNKRLYDMFGLTVEVLDASLDEVWAGRSENPELWSLLEATVAGGASFEDVAVERAFGRPSGRPLRFSGHFIPEDGERAALMLVTITE